MDEKDLLKRLVLIKYLFKIGLKQSYFPKPLSSPSILMFHDSVELFFYLAGDYCGITSTGNIPFDDYPSAIEKKMKSVQITHKILLKQLNKVRVNFKHHGLLPSDMDIEKFSSSLLHFFQENTQTIFNKSFEDISLIEIVNSELARNELYIAQEKINTGDYDDTKEHFARAFLSLINDYEQKKLNKNGHSPYKIGNTLPISDLLGPDEELEQKYPEISDRFEIFKDRIEDVILTIDEMRLLFKIMILGFDINKYLRFKNIILILNTYNANLCITESKYERPIKENEAHFCFDFIIECAMKLNEFDYSLSEYINTQQRIDDYF